MTQSIQKLLILVLAAGFCVMLGVTVKERITNPSLMQEIPLAQPQSSGQTEESPLARLMREMGEQPNNPEILMELSVQLIAQGNLEQAQILLERTRVLDVNNADVPYYQGYIAYQLKDYAKAAHLMEESLAMKDRAEVHYSLGSIYRYFLKDTPKALLHWQQGLQSMDLTEPQKTQLQNEISKAQQAD